MKQLAVPLLALGGLIQVCGVAYAFLGFASPNWPVLIGAVVVGTMLEMGGVLLLSGGR